MIDIKILEKQFKYLKIYGSDTSIYTPFKLVNEMLDKLPSEVWKNPSYKFLDPCCGRGTFLICIYDRLFEGLKSIIISETKRKKHILNNMIYGIDINSIAIDIAKVTLDSKNIICENSLEYDFNMKFDVIVGNPPFNKGLLNKKTAKICQNENEIIKNAASVRIDAAFAVMCYEDLLKEKGISLLIYPERWMMLPTWLNFRKWILNNRGLEEIDKSSINFEGVETGVCIYTQIKNNKTKNILVKNSKRGDYIYKNDSELLPYAYGELGYSIHKKAMNYKEKIDFDYKTRNNSLYTQISSAYGLGGAISDPLLSLKDLNNNKYNTLGPIMDVHSSKNYRYIYFIDQNHKNRSLEYFKSKIFNFVFHQLRCDFNNSSGNISILPDVTKNMIGEYSDEKTVKELDLTSEELKHIYDQF